MKQLGRQLLVLLLAAAPVVAQDDKEDIGARVKRLEALLEAELSKGDQRDARIQELEDALRKATDAMAQSSDRRQIESEIDSYLEENMPDDGIPPERSRLSIGGVIVGSYRATEFRGSSANTNTFQVEERYLRFVYRFTGQVTARYYTDGSLAELEVHQSDLLQVNLGVIVVPFGQFNQRSFPDTFDTLSRPLLYLGDEDIFATPPNNPKPVFRSVYSDTGIVVSGSIYGGENRRFDQIYYAVFITNGLVGVGDLAGGSAFSDNNDNKQIGARITYSTTRWIEGVLFGFGFSWMSGKYDRNDMLSYRMTGGDLVLRLDNMFRNRAGSLTIRAEYVYAPREIVAGTVADPTVLVTDANRTQGAYVIIEARVDARWMVYVQFDWLSQRAPLLANGLIDPANADAVRSEIKRYALGIVHKFEIGIIWKFEYAFWDFDQGAPDAHRFATQVVVPF